MYQCGMEVSAPVKVRLHTGNEKESAMIIATPRSDGKGFEVCITGMTKNVSVSIDKKYYKWNSDIDHDL